MKCRNRLMTTLLLTALAVQISVSRDANAWCAFAHYEITKNAGYPDIADYSQLPDYVPSFRFVQVTGLPEVYKVGDISHYFLWGHAAQKAGETSLGFLNLELLGYWLQKDGHSFPLPIWAAAPLKPTYPDDGRYPCVNMVILIRKLVNLSAQEHDEMIKTAKGFAAHNAADRVVHYDLFGGAKAEHSANDGVTEWLLDHAAKEKWADYWIYINNYFAGDDEAAFEAGEEGKLILIGDHTDGTPCAPPTDAMARIMQLSQKVYSKNRAFTNAGESYYTLTPQSIELIKDAIQNEICAKLTREHIRTKYNKANFNWLETKSINLGWDIEDVLERYDAAVNNVKAWMSALDNE